MSHLPRRYRFLETGLFIYRISSNRSPRLLLEQPGSSMNMTLFKTPRFLVSYLLLQSEIPAVLLITQYARMTQCTTVLRGNVQLVV